MPKNYMEISIDNELYYIRYKTRFMLLDKLEIYKIEGSNSLGMKRLKKIDTKIIKLGTHKENLEFLIDKILFKIRKKCNQKWRKHFGSYSSGSSD